MKWKTSPKEYNTEWHKVFIWLPTKTQDGYTVMLETVWRKWRVHMDGGKYIYVANNKTFK